MNLREVHSNEFELDAPVPTDEIEYEIADDVEIGVEVELLRARVQAARSWGA